MGGDQILEYPVDMTKFEKKKKTLPQVESYWLLPPKKKITSGYSSLRPCSAALRLYLDFQVPERVTPPHLDSIES